MRWYEWIVAGARGVVSTLEFYLAAMLKHASDGRVTRLTYTYFDLAHSEIVRVDYETGTGPVGAVEFPVNDMGLLEIAAEVIDQTRRALA